MSVFNSLGSNYTFSTAWRTLFSVSHKKQVEKLSAFLANRYRGEVILTYKGREAITIALQRINKPGSTVVVNGYTCYAVYQAIQTAGYKATYLDIPSGGLNFTAASLEKLVGENPDISTVMIQNTLGYPCDIQGITNVCRKHNLILIEDLAHCIGTQYATGEEAGTVGHFVILSFSQDKVVDAVSGGALIVRDPAFQEKGVAAGVIPLKRQLKDRLYPLLSTLIRSTHGYFVGRVIHKICRMLNCLPRPLTREDTSEVHALPAWYAPNILRGYQEVAADIAHKREMVGIYASVLPAEITMPEIVETAATGTCLRFPILIKEREKLIHYLKVRKIYVSDIWYDSPLAPKSLTPETDYKGQCPQGERVANLMVNLPTHRNVSALQAREIAVIIKEWLKNRV